MMEGFKYTRAPEVDPKDPAGHDLELQVGDESVGYAKLVYFSKPIPVYEVGTLYINEDKRGQRYGSKLMEEIERMLKEKGKAGILREGIDELEENVPEAQGMYERRGWLPVPGNPRWFVYNLPTGVAPEKLYNFNERQHTPQRVERLMRRHNSRGEDDTSLT